MFFGSVPICGNSVLMGLLNSYIAGLGILAPIIVGLSSMHISQTVYMPLPAHCSGSDTVVSQPGLYLGTCKIPKIFLKHNFWLYLKQFLGRPNSENTTLVAHIKSSANMLSTFFTQEFAVVIYIVQ